MEAWTWDLAGGNYGSSTVYPFSIELLEKIDLDLVSKRLEKVYRSKVVFCVVYKLDITMYGIWICKSL
jgi:hypothetical protein